MQNNEGTIVAWKEDRGFGFIQPEAGEKDIFIHIKAFQHVNYKPKIGDVVFYKTERDATGRIRACEAYVKGLEVVPQSPGKNEGRQGEIGYLLTSLVCFPFVISVYLAFERKLLWPLFLYAGMSLLSYLCYFIDKEKARNNHWRIPESVLLLLDLSGGWPGGLAAQQIIRHKNKKTIFQIFFWIIVVLHFILWTDTILFDGHIMQQLNSDGLNALFKLKGSD